MAGVIPTFSSPQEEIEYWKQQCDEKQQKIQELEEEFNDFQQSSKELEEELEQEVQQAQGRTKDIQTQFARYKQTMEEELEKARFKAQESTRTALRQQEELEKLKEEKKRLLVEQRTLEQSNDDLERREREHDATINDLTEKLDRMYEESVWLRTELDDVKKNSEEIIQRLKDELRDQKVELSVLRQTSFREQVAQNRNPACLALVNDMLSIVKGLEKRLTSQSTPIPTNKEVSTKGGSSILPRSQSDRNAVYNGVHPTGNGYSKEGLHHTNDTSASSHNHVHPHGHESASKAPFQPPQLLRNSTYQGFGHPS